MTLNSKKLVEQVKAGDTTVIKYFYLNEKTGFKLWLSSRYDMKEEDINDIYQEAMLILLENIRKGCLDQLSSELKTYLYAIGKHLVYGRYKKQKKDIDNFNYLKEHSIIYTEELYDLENEQMFRELSKAVSAIEEPCNTILTLFYYKNLRARQIANLLGYKNEGVVRNQKKRCVERLKNMLYEIKRRTNR